MTSCAQFISVCSSSTDWSNHSGAVRQVCCSAPVGPFRGNWTGAELPVTWVSTKFKRDAYERQPHDHPTPVGRGWKLPPPGGWNACSSSTWPTKPTLSGGDDMRIPNPIQGGPTIILGMKSPTKTGVAVASYRVPRGRPTWLAKSPP